MPAFVSTLAICIVFVPMFFLTGVARYLFVPLAEAVVFAMLASYLLSRTLVPDHGQVSACGATKRKPATCPGQAAIRWCGCRSALKRAFERFRERYHRDARACLHHRTAVSAGASLPSAGVRSRF